MPRRIGREAAGAEIALEDLALPDDGASMRAERRLERIESLIEGLEKRLWMTVYGVVAVILTQAVQSILQFGPKGG